MQSGGTQDPVHQEFSRRLTKSQPCPLYNAEGKPAKALNETRERIDSSYLGSPWSRITVLRKVLPSPASFKRCYQKKTPKEENLDIFHYITHPICFIDNFV